VVPPGALPAAQAEAAKMPQLPGLWREVTNQPYNAEPKGYDDPVESNAGTGFGLVGGRMTALATDGSIIYAGAAEGGVWRSFDSGQHWWPAWSGLGSQSTGA